MKLSGLNAIITGASQGLGLEIARHFVREGAGVALCARDAGRLNTATAELRAIAPSGQKIVAAPCDVSDPAAVNAFAANAIKSLGSVQVLVNNAGIYGPKGPTESVNLEEWKRALEINLFGGLLPCRALIPHLKAQGRGKIINVASVAAFRGMPQEVMNAIPYNTSKGGLIAFTRDLAVKWARFGINVNAIAPGWFPSDLSQQVLDESGPLLMQSIPLGRYGGPDDLKGAVIYLASAASNFVTGATLPVDGGQLAC